MNSGNISFHVEVISLLNQLTGGMVTVEVRIPLHMEKDVFMHRHRLGQCRALNR